MRWIGCYKDADANVGLTAVDTAADLGQVTRLGGMTALREPISIATSLLGSTAGH